MSHTCDCGVWPSLSSSRGRHSFQCQSYCINTIVWGGGRRLTSQPAVLMGRGPLMTQKQGLGIPTQTHTHTQLPGIRGGKHIPWWLSSLNTFSGAFGKYRHTRVWAALQRAVAAGKSLQCCNRLTCHPVLFLCLYVHVCVCVWHFVSAPHPQLSDMMSVLHTVARSHSRDENTSETSQRQNRGRLRYCSQKGNEMRYSKTCFSAESQTLSAEADSEEFTHASSRFNRKHMASCCSGTPSFFLSFIRYTPSGCVENINVFKSQN